MSFLDDLASVSTLQSAWQTVASKRGMAGIDRVSVDDFATDLNSNLRRLADEIASGRYRTLPVLRIRPRFLATSDRALVVPTVRDRVLQRAIAELLAPKIDPDLPPACRAFRKGASARGAADDVGAWISEGFPWVLRTDVKAFFDSIRPELVLERLQSYVDPAGLRFLDRLLRQKIYDHDQVSDLAGIAQGSPLSPLLANLYLKEVDEVLSAELPRYVRYCDDILALTAEEAAAREARARVEALIAPLGLTLNEDKTRVCRAEDGFTFLGFHFGPSGRGPATKAVDALQARLEELGGSEDLDLAELDAVYRGWRTYFGDHPECWIGSPAGLLALLRGTKPEELEPLIARLEEARERLGAVPAGLALHLARACSSAGRPELAWLELADAFAGSQPTSEVLAEWAPVLGLGLAALSGMAPRLAGGPEARKTALSEAAAELGNFEVASRLAALRARSEGPRRRTVDAKGTGLLLDEADVRELLSWFEGREGVHAVETLGRNGRRSFVPVYREITAEDWSEHLRGAVTLALPLIRAGNLASLGVLDVDVERKALAEHGGQADDLLGRAFGAALRLRHELSRRGCASLLESSGYKGYHLWLRLAEPLPAFRLRRWLLAIVEAVRPLPEGIRVEVFPNRDRLREGEVGPVVKLPLGVHSKTGRRCHLVDEHAQPVDDPMETLRAVAPVPRSVIWEQSEERPRGAEESAPEAAIGPLARRVLDGCKILGYLESKARDTAYLDHTERSTLLCTLGHLGEEGRAALHAIIGHTYNYSREVTERHAQRVPEYPMSCPKVRERHPEAAAIAPCTCRFTLRGRGYPTPLLFALKPSEIPVFKAKSRDRPSSPPQGPGDGGATPKVSAGLQREAEVLLRKLAELNRHRRGVEGSIARVERELEEVLGRAEAHGLQTSLGFLRRIEPSEAGEGPVRRRFVIEV